MDESDAKRLADMMAARLTEPIKHFDASNFRDPLTLRYILWLGLMLGCSMRKAYPEVQDKFPVSEKFLSAYFAAPQDAQLLRNLIYEGLKMSDEDPTALEDELELIRKGTLIRAARKEMKTVFDEIWPSGPPGSDRKITTEDLPKLAERSGRLRPVLAQLLRLQQDFPTKQWNELVQFLFGEQPRECTYLKYRLDRLPELMKWPAFASAKTTKSKASILADLLVGSDFDLRPRYARQKAQEARRLVHGKQRKRSPRLLSKKRGPRETL
jgi:hypothetical protein